MYTNGDLEGFRITTPEEVLPVKRRMSETNASLRGNQPTATVQSDRKLSKSETTQKHSQAGNSSSLTHDVGKWNRIMEKCVKIHS